MTPFQELKSLPWATHGRLETFEEIAGKLKLQRATASALSGAPKISVIIPVVEDLVDLEGFSRLCASVKAQTYPYWEAIFVSRGKNEPSKILAMHDKPENFRWIELSETATLVDLKNEGLARAEGEWWMVLDSDGVLHPGALYFFAIEILRHPQNKFFYANEIELDEEGAGIATFLGKPEESWIDLLHFPYVGRPCLVNREASSEKFDATYPHWHEYDRYFRAFEREQKIGSLPQYLYYRRRPAPMDGISAAEWKKLVESHLRRKGFPASLEVKDLNGASRVKVTPILSRGADRWISAIICFRDKVELTLQAAEHLARQAKQVNLDLILVDNESQPSEIEKLKAGLAKIPCAYRIVEYPHPFNFAAMNNFAVREHARGEFILILNNDVFFQGEHALDEMAAWAAVPQIGTVGIRLDFPDGRVQHAGLVARFGGEARLARVSNQQNADRYTWETREVFANTFAACLLRRQVFDRVGGLRELECANGFGDLIFNFECLRQGLKNIHLGHVSATHLESASRGVQYEYWEEATIEREFADILAKMLRHDLGENRVPGADRDVGATLKAAISQGLTEKAPRLKKSLKNTWDLFSKLSS